MFAELDEALKQLLIREVPLPEAEVDVLFERPDRENVARFNKPTVDLFLFDLKENDDLRQSGWSKTAEVEDGTRLRWPPARLDLRYLVTVWAQAVDDEHRLLFHLYRALRRLSALPDDLRTGALEVQEKPLYLAIEDEELDTLVDVWGVLDNVMQPGFVLRATVAIDLNGAREAPIVRTATLRFGAPRLVPETRNRIGGRITDAEGRPITGARVSVGHRLAVTDHEGRFNVAPVAAGEVEVGAHLPGRPRSSVRRRIPATYDLALAAPAEEGGPRRRRGGEHRAET